MQAIEKEERSKEGEQAINKRNVPGTGYWELVVKRLRKKREEKNRGAKIKNQNKIFSNFDLC